MKIELNDQDVGVVMAGLGKLPLEVAIGTWGRIQMQLQQAAAKANVDVQTAKRKAEEEDAKAKATKLNGEDHDVQELTRIVEGGR